MIKLWPQVKSGTYECLRTESQQITHRKEAHHPHVWSDDIPTRRFWVVWVCAVAGSFLLALRCQRQMEPETMFTLVSQLWYADGKFTENEWCSCLAALRRGQRVNTQSLMVRRWAQWLTRNCEDALIPLICHSILPGLTVKSWCFSCLINPVSRDSRGHEWAGTRVLESSDTEKGKLWWTLLCDSVNLCFLTIHLCSKKENPGCVNFMMNIGGAHVFVETKIFEYFLPIERSQLAELVVFWSCMRICPHSDETQKRHLH